MCLVCSSRGPADPIRLWQSVEDIWPRHEDHAGPINYVANRCSSVQTSATEWIRRSRSGLSMLPAANIPPGTNHVALTGMLLVSGHAFTKISLVAIGPYCELICPVARVPYCDTPCSSNLTLAHRCVATSASTPPRQTPCIKSKWTMQLECAKHCLHLNQNLLSHGTTDWGRYGHYRLHRLEADEQRLRPLTDCTAH